MTKQQQERKSRIIAIAFAQGVDFSGLEVTDAPYNLRLQPIPIDVKEAIRKDASHCVFANAANRQYGSQRGCVFWKMSAYIDLIDDDGIRKVFRFRVDSRTRHLIENFDRGEPIQIGRPFILRSIIETNSLKHLSERSRRYDHTAKGQVSRRHSNVIGQLKATTKKLAQLKREKSRTPKVIKKIKELKIKMQKQSETIKSIEKDRLKVGLGKRQTYRHTVTGFELSPRSGSGKFNLVPSRT